MRAMTTTTTAARRCATTVVAMVGWRAELRQTRANKLLVDMTQLHANVDQITIH
jgi:hypothetical protein